MRTIFERYLTLKSIGALVANLRSLGISAATSTLVTTYNSCRNRHCPKCQGAAART